MIERYKVDDAAQRKLDLLRPKQEVVFANCARRRVPHRRGPAPNPNAPILGAQGRVAGASALTAGLQAVHSAGRAKQHVRSVNCAHARSRPPSSRLVGGEGGKLRPPLIRVPTRLEGSAHQQAAEADVDDLEDVQIGRAHV